MNGPKYVELLKENKKSVADPDIPFRGGGGHEMRLNVKGTVGSLKGEN